MITGDASTMRNMTLEIKKIAGRSGVTAGVTPTDRLEGPMSSDTGYLLRGCRSVIVLMAPLEKGAVERYLSKEDRLGYQEHETEVYRCLYGTGQKLRAFLASEGYESVVPEPNLDYRYKDSVGYRMVPYPVKQAVADWFAAESGQAARGLKRRIAGYIYKSGYAAVDWNLTPTFSLRYGAVAAGLGTLGWSGNVLSPEHGARVLFAAVLTSAALEPDPMIDGQTCDGCRLCVKSCQSGFIDMSAEDRVSISERELAHARKGHNIRCIMVCAGLSGKNLHQEWSTWSPGRVRLPDEDDRIESFFREFVLDNLWRNNYYSRVLADLAYHSELGFIRKREDRFQTTCGNCQLVCGATPEERKKSYRLLLEGGDVDS